MIRQGALLRWPLWTSVGIHVVGLATAGSVVALAHHEVERVLVPVEIVRVEPPPPAPPEKPKMSRQVTPPSPVAITASILRMRAQPCLQLRPQIAKSKGARGALVQI